MAIEKYYDTTLIKKAILAEYPSVKAFCDEMSAEVKNSERIRAGIGGKRKLEEDEIKIIAKKISSLTTSEVRRCFETTKIREVNTHVTVNVQAISKLCEKKNINIQQLSEATGVKAPRIYSWKRNPITGVNALKAIAEYFDVPVEVLYKENNLKKEKSDIGDPIVKINFKALLAVIEKAGYTQSDFCAHAYIARRTFDQWKKNEEIHLSIIKKIASVLEIPCDDFLNKITSAVFEEENPLVDYDCEALIAAVENSKYKMYQLCKAAGVANISYSTLRKSGRIRLSTLKSYSSMLEIPYETFLKKEEVTTKTKQRVKAKAIKKDQSDIKEPVKEEKASIEDTLKDTALCAKVTDTVNKLERIDDNELDIIKMLIANNKNQLTLGEAEILLAEAITKMNIDQKELLSTESLNNRNATNRVADEISKSNMLNKVDNDLLEKIHNMMVESYNKLEHFDNKLAQHTNMLDQLNHRLGKLEKESTTKEFDPFTFDFDGFQGKKTTTRREQPVQKKIAKPINKPVIKTVHISKSTPEQLIEGFNANDSYDEYKTKIYGMIGYIAEKTNSDFKPTLRLYYEYLHNSVRVNYFELEKDYEERYGCKHKHGSLELIYENFGLRQVFYNQIAVDLKKMINTQAEVINK